jgi:hypothetical protein
MLVSLSAKLIYRTDQDGYERLFGIGSTRHGSRDMIAPMTDRTTKLLLLLIALAIFANTVVSLTRPVRARAADSFSCDGTLKANAYGGTQATIGGYKVDIDCR